MKNVKITPKFILLIVPLLLLSVFAIVLFATQTISIFNSSKTICYNEIAVIVLCVITLLVSVIALVLARYINGNIKYITDINKKLSNGDFSVSVDKKCISKDELGQLCASTDDVVNRLRGYVGYISETVEVLKSVTSGHLWINLKQDFSGEFEVLKYTLFGLSDTLNAILKDIVESANQVDEGAVVLSTAAQTLSQGATEQASSIQELSASISEVSQQIKKSAEDAEKAKALSTEAAQIMQVSVNDMELAQQAMNEISATSLNIGKVIKTIDDIAFQTNILALNAAVEAARAGVAGKGFAVVADEVRNLSQKSAEAAKNTAGLIESSIEAVEKGAALVNKTSTGFSVVAAKAVEVGKLVENISDQVQEQAGSISQISLGVEQVSSVVQTNSAIAEENAASSEELSAQASNLKSSVSRFVLY